MRLVTGLAILLAACAPADADPSFVVRDSAGVTITESTSPAWREGRGWRLAAGPELQIGVVAGDPDYEFHLIAGVRFLSDGGIAVVDVGTASLRLFSPRGFLVGRAGGHGRAPGEFLDVSDVRVARADTLLVEDLRLQRLTRFTRDCRVVDVIDFHMPGIERLGSIRPLPDGRLLIEPAFTSRVLGPRPAEGLYRPAKPLFVFDVDGELHDTLGVFPGSEVRVAPAGGGIAIGPPWFGRDLTLDVRGSDIWIGTGDLLEVRSYSEDGSLRRIARVPGADLAITPADLDALRRRTIARRPPGERAALERFFAEERFPGRRAAYSRIIVDDAGNVWTSPAGTETLPYGPWNIFAPDGRWLGEFEFPAGFRVHDFRNGRVLGSWQDDLDVEYIRVYRIEKT